MTNKPKKPEKVDTIVGQMKGVPSSTSEQLFSPALLKDIKQLIEGARARAAAAVNSEMVRLYWSIGERIRKDILAFERAAYGEQIVDALSRQLGGEYGRGFSRPNLFHMIRFAETFPDRKIVYALSRQLSWTHLRQIIYLDDPLQREFYAHMCRIERWSTRTLQEKIQGMLYERTAISRKPGYLAREELDALRDEDRVSPDLVFRDPYLLDFLGLKDTYSEKDLETAILRDLEHFLLELGSDLSFVARQKRITVDNEDFLPSPFAPAARGGTQIGPVPCRRQGADGTLPPLARKARMPAGRRIAFGSDPLCREVCRVCRTAAA
jgi:predicted nuclease of restriction endonuclease-like (RecB) superfamily